ncbi:formate dehydrogenase subunit gamma [Novosphingobium beihaiensis]|uniref:Formate dehydrogenase subunit gamma n=1 Tax=Novosphingobium beihaiensis TaxID=2930389 RepID=A0ABT0BPC4_9SPHN|nr:formate dehydrogenase subunit gamma [Novosphingobium beihaiensis]MCJ2186554.1 formate dehydrogenase subunit gamma [Novosphingobium beihaiensis]
MTDLSEIQAVIDGTVHATTRGALLPLLHELQEAFGFIAPAAVPLIAGALNLSRAEVHGVISFYPDFRTEPPARHVVKLCRAESCQARGGAAIEAALAHRLGVAMGHARKDGQVALEPVYCLGLCAIGPNALVDGRPVARIDGEAAARIASEVEA